MILETHNVSDSETQRLKMPVATKQKKAQPITCQQVAEFFGHETVDLATAAAAVGCSKQTIRLMLIRDVFSDASEGPFRTSAKSVYPDEIDKWIELTHLEYAERVQALREYRIQQGRAVQRIPRKQKGGPSIAPTRSNDPR